MLRRHDIDVDEAIIHVATMVRSQLLRVGVGLGLPTSKQLRSELEYINYFDPNDSFPFLCLQNINELVSSHHL